MRKLIAAFFIVGVALVPSIASAGVNEQGDGCDHGATSKPCKDDPSLNGKDCELHGNNGGINEDHCDSTTTTTITSTTSTSTSTTTTTEIVPEVVIVVDPIVPSVTETVVDETPVVIDTAVVEAPASAPAVVESAPVAVDSPAAAPKSLPHTGSSATMILALLGFGFIGSGVFLRRLSVV